MLPPKKGSPKNKKKHEKPGHLLPTNRRMAARQTSEVEDGRGSFGPPMTGLVPLFTAGGIWLFGLGGLGAQQNKATSMFREFAWEFLSLSSLVGEFKEA